MGCLVGFLRGGRGPFLGFARKIGGDVEPGLLQGFRRRFLRLPGGFLCCGRSFANRVFLSRLGLGVGGFGRLLGLLCGLLGLLRRLRRRFGGFRLHGLARGGQSLLLSGGQRLLSLCRGVERLGRLLLRLRRLPRVVGRFACALSRFLRGGGRILRLVSGFAIADDFGGIGGPLLRLGERVLRLRSFLQGPCGLLQRLGLRRRRLRSFARLLGGRLGGLDGLAGLLSRVPGLGRLRLLRFLLGFGGILQRPGGLLQFLLRLLRRLHRLRRIAGGLHRLVGGIGALARPLGGILDGRGVLCLLGGLLRLDGSLVGLDLRLTRLRDGLLRLGFPASLIRGFLRFFRSLVGVRSRLLRRGDELQRLGGILGRLFLHGLADRVLRLIRFGACLLRARFRGLFNLAASGRRFRGVSRGIGQLLRLLLGGGRIGLGFGGIIRSHLVLGFVALALRLLERARGLLRKLRGAFRGLSPVAEALLDFARLGFERFGAAGEVLLTGPGDLLRRGLLPGLGRGFCKGLGGNVAQSRIHEGLRLLAELLLFGGESRGLGLRLVEFLLSVFKHGFERLGLVDQRLLQFAAERVLLLEQRGHLQFLLEFVRLAGERGLLHGEFIEFDELLEVFREVLAALLKGAERLQRLLQLLLERADFLGHVLLLGEHRELRLAGRVVEVLLGGFRQVLGDRRVEALLRLRGRLFRQFLGLQQVFLHGFERLERIVLRLAVLLFLFQRLGGFTGFLEQAFDLVERLFDLFALFLGDLRGDRGGHVVEDHDDLLRKRLLRAVEVVRHVVGHLDAKADLARLRKREAAELERDVRLPGLRIGRGVQRGDGRDLEVGLVVERPLDGRRDDAEIVDHEAFEREAGEAGQLEAARLGGGDGDLRGRVAADAHGVEHGMVGVAVGVLEQHGPGALAAVGERGGPLAAAGNGDARHGEVVEAQFALHRRAVVLRRPGETRAGGRGEVVQRIGQQDVLTAGVRREGHLEVERRHVRAVDRPDLVVARDREAGHDPILEGLGDRGHEMAKDARSVRPRLHEAHALDGFAPDSSGRREADERLAVERGRGDDGDLQRRAADQVRVAGRDAQHAGVEVAHFGERRERPQEEAAGRARADDEERDEDGQRGGGRDEARLDGAQRELLLHVEILDVRARGFEHDGEEAFRADQALLAAEQFDDGGEAFLEFGVAAFDERGDAHRREGAREGDEEPARRGEQRDEQRAARQQVAPFVVEDHGRRVHGHDDEQRQQGGGERREQAAQQDDAAHAADDAAQRIRQGGGQGGELYGRRTSA